MTLHERARWAARWHAYQQVERDGFVLPALFAVAIGESSYEHGPNEPPAPAYCYSLWPDGVVR